MLLRLSDALEDGVGCVQKMERHSGYQEEPRKRARSGKVGRTGSWSPTFTKGYEAELETQVPGSGDLTSAEGNGGRGRLWSRGVTDQDGGSSGFGGAEGRLEGKRGAGSHSWRLD